MGRLHAAVEHLSSLVTTNTGKVDGLAVRVQATASAQSSTSSTLVDFGEKHSRALTAAAATTPDRPASNTGESLADTGEQADEDAEARAIVMAAKLSSWSKVAGRVVGGGAGRRGKGCAKGAPERVRVSRQRRSGAGGWS